MASKNLKKEDPSKRARLLRRVLDCINANEYDDRGDYVIFGKELDEIMDEAGIPKREIERDPDRVSLRELASDLKTQTGREHAARRTSLDKPPLMKRVRGLDHLSDEGIRSLVEYATRPESGVRPAPSEAKTIDELDAFYAQEVLAKLPKIVSRAAVLEAVELPGVPDRAGRYFKEAHRCFLYDFRIACAVLCRAVVESALKEVVDPRGEINRELAKGDSYFDELVKAAKTLGDDRPCATDVKKAGNYAIHDVKRFENEYGGERLDEVLHNTRKVLVDLYGSTGAGEGLAR